MSAPDQNNVISLKIIKFPHNLIIPSDENVLSFQAMNYLNKQENFKFIIEGENLGLTIPEEFKENVVFGPSETKNFDINLSPVIDGFGKLIVNISWMKPVEYVEKIQKVRAAVPQSKSKKVLKKKVLSVSKNVDKFNPKDFIVSMKVKKFIAFENQLLLKRTKIKQTPVLKQAWDARVARTGDGTPSQLPSGQDSIPDVVLENIDYDIKQLAKAYLAKKNLEKALELAMGLSDEGTKIDFYYNLIRAYSSLNIEEALQVIKKARKSKKKEDLIRKLALDRVDIDPEQSGRIAFLIEDPEVKEELMKDIIGKTIDKDPLMALKLSYLIDDPKYKIKALLSIARRLNEKNKKADLVDVLNQIIIIFKDMDSNIFIQNNFSNKEYENYRDVLYCLAEADSPNSVNTIIESLSPQQLQEKIAMDLFNDIYEMFEEIKFKLEPTVIFSQYYMFNTIISNLNNAVKDFSLIGGNISNNLLLKDFNFNCLFLALFNFDFSIFPVIDRVYMDLRMNLQKSFAYYIYPSIDNHKESELNVINKTLNQFIVSNLGSIPGQVFIYNLDFIPYLGKPTIIIASEPEIYNYINSKLILPLGNDVNIIIDESLFQGGSTVDNLKNIFPPNKCKIVNMVLSYEFINDYEMLKKVIEALV